MTLTKRDVDAFKKAKEVAAFRNDSDEGLRLTFNVPAPKYTMEDTVTFHRVLPVRSTTVDGASESAECWYDIPNPQIWETLGRVLRANNTLKLHWVAGKPDADDTVRDELWLVVERPGKKDNAGATTSVLHFLLGVYVGPTTERMVKDVAPGQ